MWLLNTKTYRLRYFNNEQAPPYAILSHTWESQEVTFRLMSQCGLVDEEDEGEADSTALDNFPLMLEMQYYHRQRLHSKKGWAKIVHFCDIAHQMRHEYGWVDTCCINKDSSSELQEAINTMYLWYEQAKLCLVYMSDVSLGDQLRSEEVLEIPITQFEASRWFTRGWTLQELLAPKQGTIEFLDCNWTTMGTDITLGEHVSRATGIPEIIMCDAKGFNYTKQEMIQRQSICQRMSWASNRKTTRGEDTAYCLLGIFRVSMPLLYGEGRVRAFRRLQEEIIKTSNDESIFAWPSLHSLFPWEAFYNILAHSPAKFSGGEKIRRSLEQDRARPFVWTKRGLQIHLNLRHLEHVDTSSPLHKTGNIIHTHVAPLGCFKVDTRGKALDVFFLLRFNEHNGEMRLVGVGFDTYDWAARDWWNIPCEVFLPTELPETDLLSILDRDSKAV